MIKSNDFQESLKNPVLYLVLSNFLVLIFAVFFNWNIGEIIWTFLVQSIIIGFFNFLRIIQMRNLTQKKEQEKILNPFIAMILFSMSKIFFGLFFLIHYGLFQLGYMAFMISLFKNVNASHVLISGAFFIIPHFISYIQKIKLDRKKEITIENLMTIPYLRIIPMHVIIFVAVIVGPENIFTLAAFLILKTIVDVKMHLVERKLNES